MLGPPACLGVGANAPPLRVRTLRGRLHVRAARAAGPGRSEARTATPRRAVAQPAAWWVPTTELLCRPPVQQRRDRRQPPRPLADDKQQLAGVLANSPGDTVMVATRPPGRWSSTLNARLPAAAVATTRLQLQRASRTQGGGGAAGRAEGARRATGFEVIQPCNAIILRSRTLAPAQLDRSEDRCRVGAVKLLSGLSST